MNYQSFVDNFIKHPEITKYIEKANLSKKKELELKKAVLEYFDQLIIKKVSEVISDEDASEIDTITKLFNSGKIDRERVILNASIIFSKYDLKGIYADFIQIVIPEKIQEFEKTGFNDKKN